MCLLRKARKAYGRLGQTVLIKSKAKEAVAVVTASLRIFIGILSKARKEEVEHENIRNVLWRQIKAR